MRSILETGAVLAVTLQPADQGDTTTIVETLAEAGGNVADLIGREAAEPGVNLEVIEEVVGDKGYHSGAALVRMKESGVRTYIPEKRQAGKRHWTGKKDEQQAVYANRQRVSGNYGKSLLRKRGELIERSFAHCYDTGAMRRTHLRGHENILKRQLIHVGAFNLSLIFRSLIGAGTPRELRNRLALLALCWSGSLTACGTRMALQTPLLLTAVFLSCPITPSMCLTAARQKDGVAPRTARETRWLSTSNSSTNCWRTTKIQKTS